MTAVKKGIALIMLTVVMLIGSVSQTLAASASTTIITNPNQWHPFSTSPGYRYNWEVVNPNDRDLTADVLIGDSQRFAVPGNNSVQGSSLATSTTGWVRTSLQAIFRYSRVNALKAPVESAPGIAPAVENDSLNDEEVSNSNTCGELEPKTLKRNESCTFRSGPKPNGRNIVITNNSSDDENALGEAKIILDEMMTKRTSPIYECETGLIQIGPGRTTIVTCQPEQNGIYKIMNLGRLGSANIDVTIHPRL